MKINANYFNEITGQQIKIESICSNQLEEITKNIWNLFYPNQSFPYEKEDFIEPNFSDDFLTTSFPGLKFCQELENDILNGAKIVRYWRGRFNAVILVRFPKGQFKKLEGYNREFE